jgi:uncharacterized Zn-binding protein involved in type VI secretion
MKPGARVTDPHTCPQQSPAPHVAGPVVGPGAPTVLLEHLPGCVVGDACTCAAGPPDLTLISSSTVMYEGKFAVRVGDPTAHGGVIVGGAGTVLVGD